MKHTFVKTSMRFFAIIAMVSMATSCQKYSEKDLLGDWKAESVERKLTGGETKVYPVAEDDHLILMKNGKAQYTNFILYSGLDDAEWLLRNDSLIVITGFEAMHQIGGKIIEVTNTRLVIENTGSKGYMREVYTKVK